MKTEIQQLKPVWRWQVNAVFALALIVVSVIAISIGPVNLNFNGIISTMLGRSSLLTDQERILLLEIRLPRVVLAALVGAALATSGAVYQTVFRNPLADPYLLGAAAGAALGGSEGAAVGAGTGLLFGSVAGADSGRYQRGTSQTMYDHAYIQCMYGAGHRVPVPAGMFSTEQRAAPKAPPPGASVPPPPPAPPPPATPR